ncbi:MAG TPA: SURF1 family protein [Pseudomonadales bacterium]
MSRFAPGWRMSLAVAALLPVLIGLGVWQLQRAAEKRGLEMRFYERLGAPPVTPPADAGQADFLRVRLVGAYQAGHDYLVDNRIREGRPGYWVVSRFEAEDGRLYLVNRGWLAAGADRDRLPAVPTPPGRVALIGVVWPDLGLPPLLEADPWAPGWPKRVQRLDVARMADGEPRIVAREIRLEPGQPGVFAAAPLQADFRPERHRAYAAQWFGLALVLAGAYLVYGFRRS